MLKVKNPICSNLAAVRLKYGNYNGTIDCCKEVIKFDPDNVKAHYRKALAYKALKRFEEGLEAASKAVKLEPGNMEIRKLRTELL